jgi:hypothetical protein
LLDQAHNARQKVIDLKPKVTDQLATADVNNSIKYLSVFDGLFNRNCQDFWKIWIGPTPYQTNLGTSQSWVLGNYTMDTLTNKYVQRITDHDNVTNCGTTTPFWDGLQCISCNEPTPIFDISTQKCIACPSGQAYDKVSVSNHIYKCGPLGPK